MIRFIDLRGQDTEYRFAYFDTITNRFVDLAGQVWDTFAEVENTPGVDVAFIDRIREITPDWAKLETQDESH